MQWIFFCITHFHLSLFRGETAGLRPALVVLVHLNYCSCLENNGESITSLYSLINSGKCTVWAEEEARFRGTIALQIYHGEVFLGERVGETKEKLVRKKEMLEEWEKRKEDGGSCMWREQGGLFCGDTCYLWAHRSLFAGQRRCRVPFHVSAVIWGSALRGQKQNNPPLIQD